MRSDVCYYFPTDVVTLYNAYAAAVAQPPFERECKQEPYHTLTFGLPVSIKYNMNGGTCILHCMPLPDGAAVDVHFVTAQAFGARYEAYAEDLAGAVAQALELTPQKAKMDVELFTQPQHKVTAARVPVTPPAPAPVAQPAPVRVAFCAHCGAQLTDGAHFCGGCGNPVPKICPNCGTLAGDGDRFCARCGNRLI